MVKKVKLQKRKGKTMKKESTRFSVEFKMKVAIEAIKEQKTVNKIAGQYQMHPNQVISWKKLLLE